MERDWLFIKVNPAEVELAETELVLTVPVEFLKLAVLEIAPVVVALTSIHTSPLALAFGSAGRVQEIAEPAVFPADP